MRVARRNDGFVPQLTVLVTQLRRFQEMFRRFGFHQCINKDAWERSAKCWNDP
jgi:hypothetical protein